MTVCLLALVPSRCRKSKQNNVPRVSLCGETFIYSTNASVAVRPVQCVARLEEMTVCFPLCPYDHACPPWHADNDPAIPVGARLSFDGAV